VIPAPRAAQVFLNRWLRRGVIAGIGAGFALPYFALLNRVRVKGASLLHRLPHRNVVFLANHQTYFLEAVAFFDLVYVRHQFDFEDPVLRFSAAEETMKKNLFTSLLARAGSVTLRRSFRDAGGDTSRPVDTRGAAKVEKAIRTGWLLHFPAGTTRRGAPLRAGVARILHNTKAVAVPVRVDGFRELLLHQQVPGKLFQECSIRIYPPLALDDFYAVPFERAAGDRVLRELEDLIGEPLSNSAAGAPSRP
jgi:1-acyl-sn-glycerol-3-phosphate acyltransferase